ncbi:microtubule-associated protein Jupiter isoform X2 [Wyeomyia smithii]|uniref:microtubule-associated protein Jupiter isoform X2 n=1 Tax=Wyeomyia smithii TaxID=174621 RepID=UPI0024680537|nr:microtubule-associated protein Jupiter isoform X2 [Wyeomyia smithii]
MTSTNFSVGFGENSKSSSKVLKPPGGGSSDLFGADNMPQTPRNSKNRMQSNIFAAPDSQKAGNVFRQGIHRYYFLGAETPRRGVAGQDSHNRLFGEVDRPYTPAKNHMKSNLPIGADQPDGVAKANGHSKTNGHHQNGNGIASNGHSNGNGSISSNGNTNGTVNGHSNGSSSALSQNGSTHSNENANPDSAYSTHSRNATSSLGGLLGSPARSRHLPYQQHQFYPSGEALNPTYASNINLCISDDIIISVTDHDEDNDDHHHDNSPASGNGKQPQTFTNAHNNANHHVTTTASISALNTNNTFAASPKSSSSSSPRSPRFNQRNPVTGNGVEDYADKPRKPSSRRGAGAENGNPVTGEGYKSGGAAEINTTVPSLNAGGHVINKNRIPPGGFSSGLW